MIFSKETTELLAEPLKEEHVKARCQAGQNLSYIEGHHAIREANRIFGFDGWIRETCDLRIVQELQVGDKWRVAYTCRARVSAACVVRDGIGYGQGINSDLGSAHESAIKEAETDAMKRALMTFGDPFGLALYDKQKEHVEKTKDSRAKGVKDGDEWLLHIGMTEQTIGYYKEDCKARGFDWLAIAKDARGAQVRDDASLQKYVSDRSKRAVNP